MKRGKKFFPVRWLAAVFFGIIAYSGGVDAQQPMSLGGYRCNDFLADAANPNNAEKLLRSMMMIAWATGYTAAHQEGAVRADAKAFELVSAALGNACHHSPNQLATEAIANAIRDFQASQDR